MPHGRVGPVIRRHATATGFLDACCPFLAAREAEHHLFFGIAGDRAREDARGTADGPAPYFGTVHDGDGQVIGAALMTPPRQLLLSCLDDDVRERAIDALVDDLATFAPPPPGVLGPVEVARAFGAAWSARYGLAARRAIAERIHRLERVVAPTGVPGRVRVAGPDDRYVLYDMVSAFHLEAFGRPEDEIARDSVDRGLDRRQRTYYLWEVDERPVSLAATAGPTPNGIRIGPVYTPPAERGHGFASAVTAAATQAELDAGRRLAFLFTDVTNPTSNKIYRAIGYEPVMDVENLVFEPATA